MKLSVALFLIVGAAAAAGLVKLYPTASNEGYAPEQPIPFSHKRHAGENKIECLYCHSGAEKSRHATIPSSNVCMNCHSVVKTDSPHIQKLRKAFSEGKPIEWIRVHELPDYVYFSHKRHLAKGAVCENCHGDVKKMERVVQAKALTMGWCMECHRGQTTPRQILTRVYPSGKVDQLGKASHGPVAPVNCTTCHN